MEFSDVIDLPLWNRARWMGTAFGGFEGEPPFIALAFQNGDAGKEVLRGLHALTGDVDERELLRVAIIEGEIPGLESGYTIHIGPRPEALFEASDRSGNPTKAIAMFSRIQRMHPKPGSSYLPGFKATFAQHGRYWLMGASLGGSAGFTLHPEPRILKTTLVFNTVEQIGANDIDRAIFVREERGPRH